MVNELKNELKKQENYQMTENGAVGYKSTGSLLTDLNFKVPSMRECISNKAMDTFVQAMDENLEYAIKWLFFTRDVRGGMGERDVFQKFYMKYAECYPLEAKATLRLIADFGRWKDIIDIINMDVADNLGGMDLVKDTFFTDIKNCMLGKPISLLAKWMPSINASNKARHQAKRFIKHFGLTCENYRKMLSKLRAYLDVTEVKTCGNRWGEVDYNRVSSNANKRYTNAFKKHDGERYNEHCTKALDKSANPNVKMHASVLYPHEIWGKYAQELESVLYSRYGVSRRQSSNSVEMNNALEAMWQNLADLGDCGNTMVVVDGSGSMTVKNKYNIMPINVSRSLGVYFAERCKGEFKNILMEFSSKPSLIDLNKCNTLKDKIIEMSKYDDCTNTDIEKVFMLILETAVKSKMSQSDMPDRILIVSDMEFDAATSKTKFGWGMKALFEELADRYEKWGYKLPKLVFWNVNSRTNTIPMIENEMGVVMVSGFSPNIMSMVMSGQMDPWLALKEKLDDKRYNCISDILKSVKADD
jgi:hypothetical protein